MQSWYEHGYFKKVIKKGMPHIEFDCRIKRLVSDAQEALVKTEERRRINKAIKKVSNLVRRHRYEKAIKFASQSKYANHPKLQKLVKQAKFQHKKRQEKRILAKLRNISSDRIELNIREYTNLIKLFPNNKKYQGKLKRYKKKLLKLRKQPPLLISQKNYGDEWPFTVPEGELECFPPGIVIFKVNAQTYAANGLAGSRGYKNIDEIWKDDQEKVREGMTFTKVSKDNIIKKGLELCNP